VIRAYYLGDALTDGVPIGIARLIRIDRLTRGIGVIWGKRVLGLDNSGEERTLRLRLRGHLKDGALIGGA
jgi:hypothetical protein